MGSHRLLRARAGTAGAGPSRRGLIGTSLAGISGLAAGFGSLGARPAAAARPGPVGGTTRLRWFGTNAWEIGFGGRTVLVDPWLTRFTAQRPDGRVDPDTPLTVDHSAVDRHLRAADLILLTHGHYDHIGDLPYVMRKFPSAPVVATETHAHLLTAMGAPTDRVIWARGGEYLDFGDFAVRVLPSLHSMGPDHRYFAPGTLTAPPRRARTVGDLLEGGTLAYHITSDSGASVVNIGTANVIERELTGLRPHVAIVAVPPCGATHRYLERVLTALGHPPHVIPTHHDQLDTPLFRPASVDPGQMRSFRDQVRALGPGCAVTEPQYCDAFTL
ncbi:MBL fold metallo-hydrolase [Streptantibioticus cattleyicolor]|uniref:Putative beta-lactamase n=2 Tax=Streptantibioticus cattleyicolor TaxID=29303 RepID=F8JNE6_STREN|nr:MBL fold metallo-hydrolase [Streptantibioticus cattleyicolor]AEW99090.1 putative beta-lactamase [Streptantibioticus cattleyicolor NRRL 8057 = DSM 46488]CAD18987.1 putative beta-lactamase [Streptantibioticus cattleyicolor]CCB71864.1 putative beta-lactamase [Streptantibioticus cattleyicolor NRRL 8057 = DSM 46488]